MKAKAIVNTALITCAILSFSATAGEKEFVGFSDVTVKGTSGWPAVNAACRNKYGDGARICAAYEIYANGGPVLPMSSKSVIGWVIPVSIDQLEFARGEGSCHAFKYAEGFGMDDGYVIDSVSGEIKEVYGDNNKEIDDPNRARRRAEENCTSSLPVACCK